VSTARGTEVQVTARDSSSSLKITLR